jgi:hypothetical protein
MRFFFLNRVVKLYRKIHQFSGALAFFTTNQWMFESPNSRNLCAELVMNKTQIQVLELKPDCFVLDYLKTTRNSFHVTLKALVGKNSLPYSAVVYACTL